MKIIGLCGQSGAGKTTALDIFKKSGFATIDCDGISRDVTQADTPCLAELVETFGKDIMNPDKTLNRRRLGEIVFIDREKLATLNAITHKYILEEVEKRLSEYEKSYSAVVIDAPVLFESGLDKRCDVTLALLADESVRVHRIMKRDLIGEAMAKERISRQLSQERLSALCDFVIYNNEDAHALEKNVLDFIRKIGESLE